MKAKLLKTIFSLTILLFLFLNAYPQLTVDAGKDTTFCISMYPDSIYLGENVTIKNGTEPYTIAWECKVSRGLYDYYTASDFLNDSTAVSPYIESWHSNGKWIKFILHVTDSENNYTKDSINVRFSSFGYTLGYFVYEVDKGDSVLFHESSVGGGIAPLNYHWQPTIGLSNPDSLITWCYADSLTEYSTSYDIIAVDSCGCVSEPNQVYEIRIRPTDVREIPSEDESLNIKQIGSKIYFDNKDYLAATVKIFSLNGQLIYEQDISDNYLEIGKLNLTKNIYIISISVDNIVGSKKISVR